MRSLLKLTFTLALLIACFFNAFAGEGYKIGDEVQDFRLKNTDGVFLSMKYYRDVKGYILIFTCNHCPYAKAYQNRIIALQQQFQPQGYPVIAINSNDPSANREDDFDSMIVRAKSARFNFPYLYDADQSVALNFGATRTPQVFVVQRKGQDKFILRYTGAIDDNYEDASAVKERYVENAVNGLIAHTYPKVVTTKAIGCTIKWRKK